MSSSTLNSATVKYSSPEPQTNSYNFAISPKAKSSTYKQPDVVFPYVWTIANMTDKINTTGNTPSTDKLQTDLFSIPGDDCQWYLDLLPQGLETTSSKKFKGHVTVLLCSKEKFNGQVSMEVFLRKHSERPNTYIKVHLNADTAKAKKIYPHANCVAAAGIAHTDLKNPAKLLLKDDLMELYIQITITGEEKTVTRIASPKSSMKEEDEMESLVSKMVEMWRRQDLTDVEVRCGGQVFRCHRLILAARSPVLKAQFEASVKEVGEVVVDIDELDVETVKEMLTYMYTGTVKHLKFKAQGLLEAADRFNLPGLKAIAEKDIILNLELHKALDIFLLADRHNAEEARSAAKDMIVNNCGEVVQQHGWKEKLSNHTSLILEIFEGIASSS